MTTLLTPILESFQTFLTVGFERAFRKNFPVRSEDRRLELTYESHSLERPRYSVAECMQRGMTHAAPLKMVTRFIIFQFGEDDDLDGDDTKRTISDIKEQEVYMGELPLMDACGAFVVDGERRFLPIHARSERSEATEATEASPLILPGDWLEGAAGEGLSEMVSAIGNYFARMKKRDAATLMPHDFFNAKPMYMALRAIFEKRAIPLDAGNPLWRVERIRTIGAPLDADALIPKAKKKKTGAPKPSKKKRAEAEAFGTPMPIAFAPSAPSVGALLVPADTRESLDLGASALRAAVVPVGAEAPRLETGHERTVAEAAGIVRRAPFAGQLQILDDATAILWPKTAALPTSPSPESMVIALEGLLGSSSLREIERWVVADGSEVTEGEVIAESDGARGGVLALGRNARVKAADPEDMKSADGKITVSQAFADAMATRRLIRYEAVTHDTVFGREELSQSATTTINDVLVEDPIDEDGIIRVGVTVNEGDPLVRIQTWARLPKSRQEARVIYEQYRTMTPEQREEEGLGPDDDGPPMIVRPVVVKKGDAGTVVSVEMFNRKGNEQIAREIAANAANEARVNAISLAAQSRNDTALVDYARDLEWRVRRGDELPPGVIRLIRVTIDQLIPLTIGDELRDRYGVANTVSEIVPHITGDADVIFPAPLDERHANEIAAVGALYLVRTTPPRR